MIVERYPELVSLDPEQKLILAGELWKIATAAAAGSPELSPEAIRMLEERLAHFEADPETGVKWEDLRDGKVSR